MKVSGSILVPTTFQTEVLSDTFVNILSDDTTLNDTHLDLVKTSDLRAGAALILAALSANGETTITDIKHLLRGYSDLISKLSNVGAKIWLEDE